MTTFGRERFDTIRVAPANILLFATLVIVAIAVANANFVITQPYFGASFDPAPNHSGIVVRTVDAHGPVAAAGIKPGDVLVAIDSDNAAKSAIISSVGFVDPDAMPRLAEFEEFMQKNGEIHRHLSSGQVQFFRVDGASFAVSPRPSWPFSALWNNSEFIGAIAVASASFLLGIMLWMHSRQHSAAVRFLFLACLANALTLWTASLFWSRELVLPEAMFRLIMMANHLGATYYPVFIVALIAIYPRRLFSPLVLRLWLAVAAIYWVNKQLMLVDLPVHNHMAWYAFCFLMCVAGIFYQWIETRFHPINRAQIIWLSLCIMLMSIAMLAYYILPLMFLSRTLAAPQWIAGVLTFFPFFGFALGITRFRLFDLPEWWFNAWTLVLTGLIILVAEIALIFIFGFHHIKSLVYAALALGWIYFPLRSWLFGYFFRSPELSAEAVLPLYVNVLSRAKNTAEFNKCLQDELGQLFSPSSLIPIVATADKVTLEDDGMTMIVPGTAPGSAFRLEAAAKATRLFNRRDAALATTLSQITNKHCAQIEAIETGIDEERGRIARDLHDTVGAKLVGLIHKSDENVSYRIREVNSAVKETIWLLRSKEAASLSYALSKWSEEIRSRLEEKDIALEWHQDASDDHLLPAHDIVSLGNILREAITNILKHSKASYVKIAIRYAQQHWLDIEISNDGSSNYPEEWRQGFGLRGLDERVQELNGELKWRCGLDGPETIMMKLTIPLQLQGEASG